MSIIREGSDFDYLVLAEEALVLGTILMRVGMTCIGLTTPSPCTDSKIPRCFLHEDCYRESSRNLGIL